MARILLLDDDRELRDVVRTILEEAGHEVHDAPDGQTGIQMYRENPSDIVITDIRMPGKTGNETILELRAEFPDVKIIAMSGGGSVGTDIYMRVAKKLGADEAISKPFAPDELLTAVRSLTHSVAV
jgi:DNA-binding response OmpR family regulator